MCKYCEEVQTTEEEYEYYADLPYTVDREFRALFATVCKNDHGEYALCADDGDYILEEYFSISHCPMCGRVLGKQEPLKLDELLRMGSSPVWVERINNDSIDEEDVRCSGWHMVHIDTYGERASLEILKKAYEQNFLFSEYGKTWLAYVQKPPEGQS